MPNPNDRVSEYFSYESDPEWPIRTVGLFCDNGCGRQIEAPIRARDLGEAYAGLRRYAATQGWTITDDRDLCPDCAPEG